MLLNGLAAQSGLPGEILASLGVAVTALLTYLGTRFTTRNKRQETRESAMEAEIIRLRSLTWDHLANLQEQISAVNEELATEKDYTDQLRDHIYLKKPPPPPTRKALPRQVDSIDLEKRHAEPTAVETSEIAIVKD